MSVGPSDSDGPGPGSAVFPYAMAAAFRTAVRDRFAATLIRTTQESAGLSQRALAARAGTSQPAVSRYESEASSPSVATLDRLLAVMGARRGLFTEGSPRRLDVRSRRMSKLRENRA